MQYKPSLLQNFSRADRDNAPLSLVKDVPMKISATFIDVPTSVQDIALFEIPTYTNAEGDKNGQLRNIKITESKTGNAPSPIKKKK